MMTSLSAGHLIMAVKRDFSEVPSVRFVTYSVELMNLELSTNSIFYAGFESLPKIL